MVTASIPYPSVAARSARTRTPLRDRVSTGTATALSVLGLIGLGAVLGSLAFGAIIIAGAAMMSLLPAMTACTGSNGSPLHG